jgi:hypothetical protein
MALDAGYDRTEAAENLPVENRQRRKKALRTTPPGPSRYQQGFAKQAMESRLVCDISSFGSVAAWENRGLSKVVGKNGIEQNGQRLGGVVDVFLVCIFWRSFALLAWPKVWPGSFLGVSGNGEVSQAPLKKAG